MPTNPNMRNDKLRAVFESLGFKNVRTVISSGNVLFETESTDVLKLETTIEQALGQQLDLTGTTTIIRSLSQLQDLLGRNPFKGAIHSREAYLTVTFLKNPTDVKLKFPYKPDGKAFKLLGSHDQAIFSTVDLSAAKTPDLMSWLEKQFTKDITTRTYKTVERIVVKMKGE